MNSYMIVLPTYGELFRIPCQTKTLFKLMIFEQLVLYREQPKLKNKREILISIKYVHRHERNYVI